MGGGGGEPKGLLVLPLKLLVGGGAAPTPGPPLPTPMLASAVVRNICFA